jgi:hypothetical protein
LILRALVKPTICKSGALTQGGSSSLSSIRISSLTGQIIRFLMSPNQKMKKDKLLVLLETLVNPTKSGLFSILIRQEKLRQRDLTKSLDSISTDHSISSLNFHSTELLRCSEELTWSSRDGETMLDNNNSSLMKKPRPSETTTGRTTASISKTMVTVTTLELHPASTQDGGRCSDIRITSLPTRKER